MKVWDSKKLKSLNGKESIHFKAGPFIVTLEAWMMSWLSVSCIQETFRTKFKTVQTWLQEAKDVANEMSP